MPDEEELKRVIKDCDEVGMTGAMGSVDVTHVHWASAPHSERPSYTGKEGYPTIAYECTVSHDLRCMSSTRGFPGANNDKTIVKFDGFVSEIREGLYKDVEYTLKGADGSDVAEKGPWLIVDGGYHYWRQLQCPIRAPSNRAEKGFKRQHESVRKDVKCFFGVVKGRFRINKVAFLYRKRERIDNIWFTCIILHNMLLSFDGIELLEADCDWAGADGELDDDMISHQPVPLPSSTAPQAEVVLRDDDFENLRQELVTNFAYRCGEGTVGWKRT